MKVLRRLSIVAAAAIAAGCSSVNPPLLFGDQTNFGVHLGNEKAAAGHEGGAQRRALALDPLRQERVAVGQARDRLGEGAIAAG